MIDVNHFFGIISAAFYSFTTTKKGGHNTMMKNPQKPKVVQVLYTIVDGEHEYFDEFFMNAKGKDDEEQARQELATSYGKDENQKKEILTELRTKDFAMTGCRAIKNVSVKNFHTIVVTVLGGAVQDITNIPEGVQVKLMDYDIESLTEDELQEKTEPDENGDRCIVSIWGD
jgi:hypothetical protein